MSPELPSGFAGFGKAHMGRCSSRAHRLVMVLPFGNGTSGEVHLCDPKRKEPGYRGRTVRHCAALSSLRPSPSVGALRCPGFPGLPEILMTKEASHPPPAELLAGSAEARSRRLDADDMLSTEQAAELVGVNRRTVVIWIERGRAIGLSQTKRGFRMPRWQFDQPLWDTLPKLSAALHTTEGWALLAFLESPLGALDGRTPRQAIEQGDGERALLLAQHNGES
ncbi:hypothetical protein [Azohydromonas aeria]|uniref:hypothetical protein n=1 Tax=Azohydromonas aeria TaxID=2590212 RepID=UPI0012FBAC41|nr:hypothetical protein [Azohydromonas aeria]